MHEEKVISTSISILYSSTSVLEQFKVKITKYMSVAGAGAGAGAEIMVKVGAGVENK